MVERRGVAREVCFDDIEIAVEIIVGGCDSHARLRFSIWTERATCFDGNVFKLAVLFILVEGAGGRIIGNINVGPAVIVEVCGEHAQAVGTVRAKNPSRFGNIGEGAVAVIVVENVLAALQAGRSAGN